MASLSEPELRAAIRKILPDDLEHATLDGLRGTYVCRHKLA
jgi:hypothetical protein